MFDSLKAMSAVASLLKNKDALAASFTRVTGELDQRIITVEGAKAADGKPGITVVVTGTLKVLSVHVHPALIASASDDAGRERLGKLITHGVNAALDRAKQVIAQAATTEAKAMGLPELPGIKEFLDQPKQG